MLHIYIYIYIYIYDISRLRVKKTLGESYIFRVNKSFNKTTKLIRKETENTNFASFDLSPQCDRRMKSSEWYDVSTGEELPTFRSYELRMLDPVIKALQSFQYQWT